MAKGDGVIFVGSFSKSIAPALRVGYIVANWDRSCRACSRSSRTPARARWSRWCWPSSAAALRRPRGHAATSVLRGKLQVLREALAEQFGTAAEFGDPPGGIFLWIKLPDQRRHAEARPGGAGGRRLASIPARNGRPTRSIPSRVCGSASPIPARKKSAQGVAVLAEVCHKEFGVPARIANVESARVR